MTTETDIRELLVRDRDAGFTAMVGAYQTGIFSGAVRLTGTRQDAEDVAQETFLRAYRSMEGWSDERIGDLRVRAWLWTIALNLCRNRATRGRSAVRLEDQHEPSSADEEPLDDAAWQRRLSALSSPQRTAVILRHVVDLPVAEIAEVTGRPEGTVKADIARGLARLRDAIETETAEEAP